MKNGKVSRNGRNGHATAKPRPLIATDNGAQTTERLPVLKTYKIFIGGKFPRTESGRFYQLKSPQTAAPIANVCLSSRKDFREAVVAARSAVWRSSVYLRIRKTSFVDTWTKNCLAA